MPYEVSAKNLMLNCLRQVISHASLHSDKPSAGNEIAGGSYVRALVEFTEAANGVITLTTKPMFGVPEGARVTHAGFWTSDRGGLLLASGTIEEATFDKPGVYVIDSAKLDLNLGGQAGIIASLH